MKIIKEDISTLYGITCKTTVRGFQSLLQMDGKTVAFTDREEASRCIQALDDNAGRVNRFVYYGVTQLPSNKSNNLLIFDSYEEYEDYSDNLITTRRNEEEIAKNKLSTITNKIVNQLKKALTNAGLNIVNAYDAHKTYKDVYISTNIFSSNAEIKIDAGISSINGWSYGSIILDVNEEGVIRSDESSCYIFDEPFEECVDYIVKCVKKLCERSNKERTKMKILKESNKQDIKEAQDYLLDLLMEFNKHRAPEQAEPYIDKIKQYISKVVKVLEDKR